jgi:EAL domain-containing protein (putative c-di-GMP-specific phosphodiesterase class I)
MQQAAFQPIRELPAGRVTSFEALAGFVSKEGTTRGSFSRTPKALMYSMVQEMLENFHVVLDWIIIELSGPVQQDDWNYLVSILKPLRQGGLRKAVDGFGNGFTSREGIRHIRPDIIKLDRHFIEGLMRSPNRDSDDHSVIGLALEIGAVRAAEGIETQSEMTAVIEAGMTADQGYLLGGPSVHHQPC